jgi:hypothetical protein
MHCRNQDRIRLAVSLAALAFALASTAVLAQGQPSEKKGSNGMPKMSPPTELSQMNKMVGNWKCTSKMHLPPEMGGEQTGSSTMVIKKDLSGYWLVGLWKAAKTKTMPEMKGTWFWGYDSAEKKFVELGVDSTGSYMRGTSDGPQGGTWTWTEEGTMMGKKTKSRTTVSQKTPDSTQVKMEIEAEPGKWVPMGEDDCKKQGGHV